MVVMRKKYFVHRAVSNVIHPSLAIGSLDFPLLAGDELLTPSTAHHPSRLVGVVTGNEKKTLASL